MAITFDQAPNFLDLGGLKTNSGEKIRSGYLFRSQALTGLPAGDIQRLQDIDFGLVCDLRSLDERLDSPNTWLNELRTKIAVAPFDPKLNAVRRADWQRHLTDPTFDRTKATSVMVAAYQAMPTTLTAVLATLFSYCDAQDYRPLLIHCAAGKDRTGYVVAMLLWALGVPYPSILENHLKSGEIYLATGRNNLLLKTVYPELAPERAIQAASIISSVQSIYLDGVFEEIKTKHGSIDNYLYQEAGLTEPRQALLKQWLLEQ